MHVLFLGDSLESRETFIDTVSSVICPSRNIFVVQHHVKVPKAILCEFLILDCLKFIPF
jgi:hypothetical protein